ncbi:MAG: peptidylprolyl isomerase [Deltaproteobacteria bacterium]|nr:peptidylprolyl isomerase [Deltaproteobacteria bacterium]
MPKHYVLVAAVTLALCSTAASAAPKKPEAKAAPANKEILFDAVVASVDGRPITLQDVCRRLNPPRSLTLKEAALDPEANAVLDTIIMDYLVTFEAEARRISVSNEEIDEYIAEVAKRNNLSREGFEQALKQEGRDITEYKGFIKIDILKSRLATSLMQSGVGVTTEEIEVYMKEHVELSSNGTKVKLAHIVIREDIHGPEGSEKIVEDIQEKISSGEDFADVARVNSDAPNAADGGMLGIIAQKDLSSDVFEAVSALKPGEVSKPIKTAQGYQIFKVIEQFTETEEDGDQEKIKDEVRKTLQRQKLAEKMNSFFTAELMKTHSVDRKI